MPNEHPLGAEERLNSKEKQLLCKVRPGGKMEGLGKSEGKAAIFAFQKMSPRAWEGGGVGLSLCGEALEGAG